MAQGDHVTSLGSRVSYLRGVLDSEKLSSDERLELALTTFIEVSERLIELLAKIREEQAEIRRILALLCDSVASRGNSQRESTQSTMPALSGERLLCPQCGQSLTIGADAPAVGPVEVHCPQCHLVLEIV